MFGDALAWHAGGRWLTAGVLVFAAAYLLVWSAAGVVAYGLFELGKALTAAGSRS